MAEIERLDTPDPKVVANKIMNALSSDEILRFAEQGVMHYSRSILAKARVAGDHSIGPTPSSRWDAVKTSSAKGELDLMRYAVYTGKSKKWLLDCSPADLLGAAEYHDELGDHHKSAAEQLTNLAAALSKQPDAVVVGDLPEQKVKGLLSA